jgi:hypothetical protein
MRIESRLNGDEADNNRCRAFSAQQLGSDTSLMVLNPVPAGLSTSSVADRSTLTHSWAP